MIGLLAQLICQLCGFTGEIRWNSEMPDGQPRRCLDTSRARHKLGFVARTKVHDGLKETIAWYRRRRRPPVHSPLEMVTNAKLR